MSATHPPGLFQKARGALQLGRALRLVWEAASGWTVVSSVLVLLQAALPILALYLVKLVVDAVAAAASAPTGQADVRSVFLLLLLAAAATLTGVAIRGVAGWVREAQSLLVTDHVLDLLHHRSSSVDYGYYEDPRFYDTLHRAQQEAPSRPTQIVDNLTQVGQSALTAVGIMALLASIHPALALLLLLAVAPTLLVRVRHAKRLYRWQQEHAVVERKARYLGWLLTLPFHAKELRLFHLAEELRRRFRDLRASLRGEHLELSRRRGIEDALTQLLAGVVVFGSFAFIAWQAILGTLSLGDLVMYFGAVQRGQATLQSLFTGLGSLYEGNLFLSTFSEFLDLEDKVVGPANPNPVPSQIRNGIRFEGVGFQYPHGQAPVLQGVDLQVGPGEMVALVGPNGSGKTSLVKLLCRLYDPDDGVVTLDGVDLKELDPDEYRRRIAVVFQDYAQYALPATDNIGFGDVESLGSRERVVLAAREAGVDQALERLPAGYDTVLGRLFPDGEELSIGEWQKVALARAFFSEAEILVMDEPTSVLDAEAEASVFRTIRRLVRDRAAVVVSHRFSTVRMADRIYVLEGGRVVEAGSHEELMARGGTYARLFSLQAAPYLSSPGEGDDLAKPRSSSGSSTGPQPNGAEEARG